jgi:hypothetical protein
LKLELAGARMAGIPRVEGVEKFDRLRPPRLSLIVIGRRLRRSVERARHADRQVRATGDGQRDVLDLLLQVRKVQGQFVGWSWLLTLRRW